MADPERTTLPTDDRTDDGEEEEFATESAPLLSDQPDNDSEIDEHDDAPLQRTSWLPWLRPGKTTARPRRKWRWASIIAMLFLAIFAVLIIVLAFIVPPAVKHYAETAAVLEPTNLIIESITPDGVRARIQANFRLDGSRVSKDDARRIGKFVTGIMRKLQTEQTTVSVHLPHYDNALLGSAVLPPLSIDIRDGHNTALDFVADLSPGHAESIRMIVNNWLDGKLDQLKVTGSTDIHLKSGILPLGTHNVVESLVFEANEVPTVPEYTIERLNFHDVPIDGSESQAIAGDVSIALYNEYPLAVDVPSLAFDVLVPNCDPSEPYILVAEAFTKEIPVKPEANVTASGKGVLREIPDVLTRSCPSSKLSPLDHIMEKYLQGDDAKLFVRGKKQPESDTPDWIESIIDGITVPIDFPGRSLGHLIKSFSLADVDFKLPSPFANPDDPDAVPRVSGTIMALAAIPEELNIDIGVEKMRADADLYYEGEKMGELNLHRWQDANSTKIYGDGDSGDLLNVTSTVVDVPLNITDGGVFGDLMKEMLFGSEEQYLDVKSAVDVTISTVLGNFVVRGVPTEGKVPVKPLPRDALTTFDPQIGDIRILNTSATGVTLSALVNCTNPTPYTASVPYITAHLLQEGRVVGQVTAEDVDVRLGNNTNLAIQATWDPTSFGGEGARDIGRRLLSDYISGKNTSITVLSHRGSIPGMPIVGEALSRFNLTLPMPHLRLPGDDEEEDGGVHFIREANFHIFSSTATFVLASPLHHNTIYLEHVNASAFYNHTELVGHITYDEPLAAPPGLSETPRLPVTWSTGDIGYGKLKEALGGTLKLDAVANLTIRLGEWVERVHYEGKGIGAKVHL